MLKENKIKLLLDLYDEGLETKEEFIAKVRKVVKEPETQADQPESKQRRRFSTSELNYIKNHPDDTVSEIARKLGRAYNTVFNYKAKRVIKSRKNKKWTTSEDKFIKKELKAGTTQAEIARKLNVRDTQLKHRIRVVRGLD